MAKNKTKPKKQVQSAHFSFVARCGKPVAVLLGITLSICLLDLLDRQQMMEHPYSQPAHLELLSVPPVIQAAIAEQSQLAGNRPWSDPTLCNAVHDGLSSSGWIKCVNSVSKHKPGKILASCQYRLPMAIVQSGEYFYLVDEYGVRLPGQYRYEPGMMLIQGLKHSAPDIGVRWPGEDMESAISAAQILLDEPFSRQVVAVRMHNFEGRQDPYTSHVVLVTDRKGARILWGSAPGHEMEENTSEQKISILRANYEQSGRIDAFHDKIDISVFPDRFIIPS